MRRRNNYICRQRRVIVRGRRAAPRAMRRNQGWCTPCRSSNGMLPRLIVLAPSASFSFNPDHYPPREHPPTCRFGRKCIERGCTHATTFSSALDEATHPHRPGISSISVTRVYTVVRTRHSAFVYRERIDVTSRLVQLPWRPANV